MSEEKQDFLRRWSRRKQEASALQKTTTAVENAPALPALDSLTFESDFKAFMHSKVEDAVKRAAVKKLFADPHFNVMDGLDTYIDDYTKADPIPPEMLRQLLQARGLLTEEDEGNDGADGKAAAPAILPTDQCSNELPDQRQPDPES